MTFRRTKVDEQLVIPAPAVSTDLDYQFNTADMQINTRLLLKNVYFEFDTDGNAANRYIIIEIQDHFALTIFRTSHATAVTANLLAYTNLSGRRYKDWDAVSQTLIMPLPDIYIYKNYHFIVDVVNDAVGDQISEVMVRFDRYEGVILE